MMLCLYDEGPGKTVTRKLKPLYNLHSLVHLIKRSLQQLVLNLQSEVILLLVTY